MAVHRRGGCGHGGLPTSVCRLQGGLAGGRAGAGWGGKGCRAAGGGAASGGGRRRAPRKSFNLPIRSAPPTGAQESRRAAGRGTGAAVPGGAAAGRGVSCGCVAEGQRRCGTRRCYCWCCSVPVSPAPPGCCGGGGAVAAATGQPQLWVMQSSQARRGGAGREVAVVHTLLVGTPPLTHSHTHVHTHAHSHTQTHTHA